MTRDELIEAMARAVYTVDVQGVEEWYGAHPRHAAKCREVASAVLSAIEAAGFAVVPVSASKRMLDASWHLTGESKEMRARTHAHYARHYTAMIAAAQEELK